jgi:predicted outer membrane protein
MRNHGDVHANCANAERSQLRIHAESQEATMDCRAISVRLGAVALMLASTASAQQRAEGSGIRISKDQGASATAAVSSTPTNPSMTVTGSELTVTTPFNLAAYTLNEKQLAMLLAGGDSVEIEIGHLVHGKATDARVRDLGMMLANDHTAHLAKTWEMITGENVGIEAIPNNTEGMRLRESLAWLQNNPASPAWDAAFLRFQAQHHQNVIDILNKNIKNAHDDDFEKHIDATLKSLAKHRDAARSVGTQLGVTVP